MSKYLVNRDNALHLHSKEVGSFTMKILLRLFLTADSVNQGLF